MPKKKHPDTSVEAYHNVVEEGIDNEHHKRIIKAFEELGSATADKIADYLGMDHVQVNRRFSELREKGILFNTGERLPTRKGRNAFVHTLQKAGQKVERKTVKSPKGKSVSDYSKNIGKIAKDVKKSKLQYIEQPLIPEHMFEKK